MKVCRKNCVHGGILLLKNGFSSKFTLLDPNCTSPKGCKCHLLNSKVWSLSSTADSKLVETVETQKSCFVPCESSSQHMANGGKLSSSLLLTFQDPGHGHFPEWNNNGCIAFNVAKANLESYLNTETSEWVTLSGTIEAMKQSLFSYVVVTFRAQGETACQSDWVTAGQTRELRSEA